MDPIVVLLLAAGFGAMWWQRWRLSAPGEPRPELAEDADIALHLALHQARSRGQAPAPVHVLAALLQDEELASTLRRTGAELEAVEDRVLTELEAGESPGEGEAGARNLIGWAMSAATRAGRPVTCADLWGGLVQTAPETARLVETGGVSAADVLFTLVHGVVAAEEPAPERGEVQVILVNDDITRQELVVEVLQDAFELSEEDSTARMLEAHTRGEGTVGSFPAEVARSAVELARRRARSCGSPLRLRLLPAGARSGGSTPGPRPPGA